MPATPGQGNMSHYQLPKDATIAVIVGRLRDPVEFVRRVLENMKECEGRFGKPVVVRIGVTGEGVVPHYRIEPKRVWQRRSGVNGSAIQMTS